jgi:L-rhamnonate dehydratase
MPDDNDRSIYSYHLQICFPNCPMAEFLIMSPKADSIGEDKVHFLRHLYRSRSLNSFLGSLLSPVSFFGDLFTDEPLPKDGYIELAHDKPGFGVTLNR